MRRFLVQIIPSILFSFIVFGCGDDKDREVNEADSVNATVQKPTIIEEIPETGTLDGDTINMNGKFVLFYGPEVGSLDEKDEKNAQIIEFRKISDQIIDSLAGNPTVFALYTSAKSVRIYNKRTGKPMVILRSTFNEPVGMIISDDSQPPMIKKGSGTKETYVNLINRLFGQPNS